MLASEALAEIVKLRPKKVLNIGDKNNSDHVKVMQKAGIDVLTIGIVEPADIVCPYQNTCVSAQDVIWCSHCLEHQVNPGLFLDKIFKDLNEGGVLALTVPPAKDQLVGGHVTIWNEAALIHQLIMAGFDCSEAKVWRYGYNISVLIEKKSLPEIKWHMNKPDLPMLKKYAPGHLF